MTAGKPTFSIITPSYYKDFEYCRLLVESVHRFVPPEVAHYLVVDRLDEALFSPLRSERTRVVLKEDVLPWWLHQLPFARRWWVSLRGVPVRGWIVQQIVKLSANLFSPTDAFLFIDSGSIFVRPFDPATRVRGDAIPLFCEQKAEVVLAWNTRWHQVAARLVGAPVKGSYDTNFVSAAVYWRRDNLERLQARIAATTGLPWAVAVSRQAKLSEYVLYGHFCREVLGAAAGHYETPRVGAVSRWAERRVTEDDLRAMLRDLADDDFLLTYNEKAKSSVDLIRRVLVTGAS